MRHTPTLADLIDSILPPAKGEQAEGIDQLSAFVVVDCDDNAADDGSVPISSCRAISIRCEPRAGVWDILYRTRMMDIGRDSGFALRWRHGQSRRLNLGMRLDKMEADPILTAVRLGITQFGASAWAGPIEPSPRIPLPLLEFRSHGALFRPTFSPMVRASALRMLKKMDPEAAAAAERDLDQGDPGRAVLVARAEQYIEEHGEMEVSRPDPATLLSFAHDPLLACERSVWRASAFDGSVALGLLAFSYYEREAEAPRGEVRLIHAPVEGERAYGNLGFRMPLAPSLARAFKEVGAIRNPVHWMADMRAASPEATIDELDRILCDGRADEACRIAAESPYLRGLFGPTDIREQLNRALAGEIDVIRDGAYLAQAPHVSILPLGSLIQKPCTGWFVADEAAREAILDDADEEPPALLAARIA